MPLYPRPARREKQEIVVTTKGNVHANHEMVGRSEPGSHSGLFSDRNARSNHTAVQCGSIVEGELLEDGNKEQAYSISLAAGDTLNFQLVPIGQTLNLAIRVFTPTGEQLTWITPGGEFALSSTTGDGGTEEGSTPILSARGV
jgi:hypothetical protein